MSCFVAGCRVLQRRVMASAPARADRSFDYAATPRRLCSG